MLFNETIIISSKIESLENELCRLLESGSNNDRANEIIDELNWYNEQYCERY